MGERWKGAREVRKERRKNEWREREGWVERKINVNEMKNGGQELSSFTDRQKSQ